MATDVSELITEPAPPPVKARRRIVGGVTLTALLVALIVVGVNARRGAVTERIKNPAVSGAPRPGPTTLGLHSLARPAAGRHGGDDGDSHRRLCGGVAATPSPPDSAHGAGHDLACLAGPDHELGPLRRLQPSVVALAGIVGIGVHVAHRRTVHRHRVCDVLHGAVLPGHLDPAPPPSPPPGGIVRLAPPPGEPLGAHLRDRVRVRHHARDVSAFGRSCTSTPRWSRSGPSRSGSGISSH